MDKRAKETWIRRVARESLGGGERILWSRHAIARLVTGALSRSAIETALASCEVIEDYPAAHRPLPDCLVLATLADATPVHAVIAVDEANERIFVVTIYRPDPVRWIDERTRKPR